jgi:hypothetical protein
MCWIFGIVCGINSHGGRKMTKTIHISKLSDEIQERILDEVELSGWDAIFIKEKSIKYYDNDGLYTKDIENLNRNGYLLVKGI